MEPSPEILDSEAIGKTYNPNVFSVERGIRLANNIIDTIAFYLLDFIYHYLTGNLGSEITDIASGITAILGPLFILFLYYFILESSTGKTLGKVITGTRVVDQNGNRPDASRIAGRTLVRFIPFEPFSFFGAEARGWHDTVSKTWVVKER